jgi:hypothetical protein
MAPPIASAWHATSSDITATQCQHPNDPGTVVSAAKTIQYFPNNYQLGAMSSNNLDLAQLSYAAPMTVMPWAGIGMTDV